MSAGEPEPVEPERVIYGPSVPYLAAIVYFSPESWSFWLNGDRVTPDQGIDLVDVVSVYRDKVDLILHVASDKPAVPVRLRPNQSFIALTGEILEGRSMASLAGYSQDW